MATSGPTEPKGDRVDWDRVLAEHRRWLRTVVLARIGDPQAVDEVMQNVALAAVREEQQLRDPAKVAPWLYRLAIGAAMEFRRREGRRRKLTDHFANLFQPSEADDRGRDGLDWLLAEEQQQLVRLALKSLARRDAEILLLKYTEDWTYAEIARHLGLSESAVEARLHRARHKLRIALRSLDPSVASSRQ